MSERRVPYLPSLAEKAGQASVEMTAEQHAARTATWQSITAMLAAVRGPLGDHLLKGLENLSTSTCPYRAAQVRRKRPWDPLPHPHQHVVASSTRRNELPMVVPTFGDPVLVLDSGAMLVLAARNGLGEVHSRPATPSDLQAEDVEAVAETLVYCLRRHLTQTGVAKERYRVLRRLAERLERALEEGENS